MKALTLKNPWAHLVRLRIKDIELRGWKTSYRGPLAIHAGMKLDKVGFESMNTSLTPDSFVYGAIVAVCNLTHIIEYTDYPLFISDGPRHMYGAIPTPENFPRYGWVLEDMRRLETPMPMKGKLGLWDVCDFLVIEFITMGDLPWH